MKHNTAKPSYYMVVFTSQRSSSDAEEYSRVARQMVELAKVQLGFLGVDSARGSDGVGITVSYWESEEAILHWKNQMDHQDAREQGREKWYEWFDVKIGKVEREYGTRKCAKLDR